MIERRGFTLVELLVVIVLTTLFVWMSYNLIETGKRAGTTMEAQVENQEEVQRVLSRITNELRVVPVSTVTCTGSTLTFDPEGANPPAQVIYTFTPNVGTYPGETGTLVRTQGADQLTLSQRLTSFSCTAPVQQVVMLQVTARTKTSQGRPLDHTVTTQVRISSP